MCFDATFAALGPYTWGVRRVMATRAEWGGDSFFRRHLFNLVIFYSSLTAMSTQTKMMYWTHNISTLIECYFQFRHRVIADAAIKIILVWNTYIHVINLSFVNLLLKWDLHKLTLFSGARWIKFRLRIGDPQTLQERRVIPPRCVLKPAIICW